MKYTIRVILREDKPDISGECPLTICITFQRKRYYKSLGIKLHPSQWNGKVKHTTRNSTLLNAKILSEVSSIEERMLKMELNKDPFTPAAIQAVLKNEQSNSSFHAHAKKVLEEMKQQRAMGTYRRNNTECNRLETLYPNLTFNDITSVWLNKYHKQLLADGMDNNTTIPAIKFIRRVFNHAKSVGVTTHYPFKDWKFPVYKEKGREYLTKEELARIKDLLNEPQEQTMKEVIVFFLLECYSGIRHSDWGKFQVEKMLEHENLILRTTKTNTRVTIPIDLNPSLQWVINYIRDNNLHFNLSLQKTNVYLKAIKSAARIDKPLTTHIGRHTFAVLLLENGSSKELIAELMGVTMNVVKTYAKYTSNKARIEFQRTGGI